MNWRSYSCFVLLLVLLLSVESIGQTMLKASANHHKIGVDDDLFVTFTFNDEMEKFKEPDLSDFIIKFGPIKSNSKGTQMIFGKQVFYASHVVSYKLKPRHTGMCVIPAAAAIMKNGSVFMSGDLNIEVIAGSNAAANMENTQKDNIAALVEDIKEANYPFVISIGSVFQEKDRSREDSNLCYSAMHGLPLVIRETTKFVDLGVYYWQYFTPMYLSPLDATYKAKYWGYVPRHYFNVQDTTGLIKMLNDFYTKDKRTRYVMRVENAITWTGADEVDYLISEHQLYLDMNDAEDSITRSSGHQMPKNIVFTFNFKTQDAQQRFFENVGKHNYTFLDSAKDDSLHYKIKVACNASLDREKMNDFATDILFLAEQEKGVYVSLSF